MNEATEVVEAEVVEEQSTTAGLAVRQERTTTALIRPATGIADIELAFREYKAVVDALLDPSDYQNISGKRFRKKSAWRKLAVAFGVDLELMDRIIERDEAGVIIRAQFVHRAIAPNGRHVDGWGGCDRSERCCAKGCRRSANHRHCPAKDGEVCPGVPHFTHAEHDIPATAETRSKNRAMADLFGMGEVSAEEIAGEGEYVEATTDRKAQPRSRNAPPDHAAPTDDGPRMHTNGQMRAIFGTARRRGIGDVQLRAEAGVETMKDLTYDQAVALLQRLGKVDPKPEMEVTDGADAAPEGKPVAAPATAPKSGERVEPAPDAADAGAAETSEKAAEPGTGDDHDVEGEAPDGTGEVVEVGLTDADLDDPNEAASREEIRRVAAMYGGIEYLAKAHKRMTGRIPERLDEFTVGGLRELERERQIVLDKQKGDE